MEKMDTSYNIIDELNYEQALAELESIVSALESGDNPLEKTLALFERGQLLAQHCSRLLEQAELKIQQISGEDLIDFPLMT